MLSKAIAALSPSGRPLTTNWKIFRAAAVVAICTLIARLVAMGKELVVANQFGRGQALDAFLIALVLPATVLSLIAGSFDATLIPTYVGLRETEGREAAHRLLAGVQVLSLTFLIVASLLLAALAPYYLPLLGSGFTAEKLRLTEHLLFLLLPFVVITGTSILWSSVLNASESFAAPAAIRALTPLTAALALLLWGGRFGISALAVGTVAGSALELLLIGRALHARGIPLGLHWYGLTPDIKKVATQFGPVLAGGIIVGISPLIDQSMAAMLKEGSVAALSYGFKIVTAVSTLSTAALATAILPYISQAVARNDWQACRRTLKVYSALVLAATIPIALVVALASRPLVRLLYQRGAFTADDTLIVSAVQIGFALVIPFSTWGMLFVRYLSALRRNDILAYIAAISACLNIVLNLVLMRRFGVPGIAWSTSLVAVICCLLLGACVLWVLRARESTGGLPRAEYATVAKGSAE